MMKRIIIGLIAIGGVALWWTDASAGCNGVGTGGSCKTGGLLGRSLVGLTRTLAPGKTTFEFFGTAGPGCNHDFTTGVLDCDCRLRGTAYCTIPEDSITASTSNGDGDHDDDDGLVPKAQTLPPGLQVNNLTTPAATTPSKGGDSGGDASYWTLFEGEPDPHCVSCPAGAPEFVTFIANRVVVRDTFTPDCGESKACLPPHTTIRRCTGGIGINPTNNIESYNCETVFECEGKACPVINTSGICGATC